MKSSYIWILVICLPGCVGKRSEMKVCSQLLPETGVWRAFRENGDKPGFGFELRIASRTITGAYYLIDPDCGGNFQKARKFPAEVIIGGPQIITFVVHVPNQESKPFSFHLSKPMAGSIVPATIEWVPNLTFLFEFKKVR